LNDDAVKLREFAPGDLAFIFSTWLRDLRDADPGPMPDDLWFPAHRSLLERIMAKPEVRVLMAVAADRPDEILGYVVAEPSEVVYWTFVRKGPLRGKGLAKMLLEAVSCPPSTPGAWTTALSKIRLRLPGRGRLVRPRLRPTSASR
jgi:hypothetical protein